MKTFNRLAASSDALESIIDLAKSGFAERKAKDLRTGHTVVRTVVERINDPVRQIFTEHFRIEEWDEQGAPRLGRNLTMLQVGYSTGDALPFRVDGDSESSPNIRIASARCPPTVLNSSGLCER
jgi:hypothetical protein